METEATTVEVSAALSETPMRRLTLLLRAAHRAPGTALHCAACAG